MGDFLSRLVQHAHGELTRALYPPVTDAFAPISADAANASANAAQAFSLTEAPLIDEISFPQLVPSTLTAIHLPSLKQLAQTISENEPIQLTMQSVDKSNPVTTLPVQLQAQSTQTNMSEMASSEPANQTVTKQSPQQVESGFETVIVPAVDSAVAQQENPKSTTPNLPQSQPLQSATHATTSSELAIQRHSQDSARPIEPIAEAGVVPPVDTAVAQQISPISDKPNRPEAKPSQPTTPETASSEPTIQKYAQDSVQPIEPIAEAGVVPPVDTAVAQQISPQSTAPKLSKDLPSQPAIPETASAEPTIQSLAQESDRPMEPIVEAGVVPPADTAIAQQISPQSTTPKLPKNLPSQPATSEPASAKPTIQSLVQESARPIEPIAEAGVVPPVDTAVAPQISPISDKPNRPVAKSSQPTTPETASSEPTIQRYAQDSVRPIEPIAEAGTVPMVDTAVALQISPQSTTSKLPKNLPSQPATPEPASAKPTIQSLVQESARPVEPIAEADVVPAVDTAVAQQISPQSTTPKLSKDLPSQPAIPETASAEPTIQSLAQESDRPMEPIVEADVVPPVDTAVAPQVSPQSTAPKLSKDLPSQPAIPETASAEPTIQSLAQESARPVEPISEASVVPAVDTAVAPQISPTSTTPNLPQAQRIQSAPSETISSELATQPFAQQPIQQVGADIMPVTDTAVVQTHPQQQRSNNTPLLVHEYVHEQKNNDGLSQVVRSGNRPQAKSQNMSGRGLVPRSEKQPLPKLKAVPVLVTNSPTKQPLLHSETTSPTTAVSPTNQIMSQESDGNQIIKPISSQPEQPILTTLITNNNDADPKRTQIRPTPNEHTLSSPTPPPQQTTIRVTIGRVEVRTSQRPAPLPQRRRPATRTTITLDDYLNGGGR